MAETTEKKIIRIEIDQSVINKSKTAALALSKEIEKIAVAQKLNTRQTDAQKAAYIENDAKLKALKTTYNQHVQVLKQANIAAEANVGSNVKLKAQLSALTSELNRLEDAGSSESEEAVLLRKNVAGLTEELKANESAVGDNRRNVGNYEGALKTLKTELREAKDAMVAAAAANGMGSKEFQEAAKKAGELKDQLDDVTQATKEMASGSKLGQFKDTLSGVGGSLKNLDFDEAAEKAQRLAAIAKSMTFSEMLGGLKSLGSALVNLGRALLVNPFFAFVAAVTAVGLALKAWSDSNDEALAAQKKLNDEFAKAQFEVRKLDIEYRKINGTITELQANVEQLAVDHSKALKEIADDTEKNLKESIGWWDKFLLISTGGSLGMGKITQAVKEQNQAVKLETIKNTKELQNLYAQDIQNSLNATAKANEEVLALGEQLAQEQIEKEKEKNEKIKEENKKRTADELAAIQAEYDQKSALRDFYNEQIKANLAEDNKAFVDANAAHIAGDAEVFNAEIAHIQKRAEIAAVDAETQITDAKALAQKKKEIILAELEAELALMQQFAQPLTQPQLDAIDLLIAKIKQLKGEASTPGAMTAAEALGMTEDDFKAMTDGMKMVADAVGNVKDIANASYEIQKNNLENLRLAEIQNVNSSVLSQTQKDLKIKQINKKFAQDQYAIEKKQFETNKALAIVQAIIQTALSVVKASPVVPLMILAGLAGAATVATIAAQSPPAAPTFATGGFVSGPGSGTSDSIDAKLSNGESVNTAKATSMFAPLISKMNAMGGGVDWYKGEGYSSGGLVQKFAGGGIASQIGNQAFQQTASDDRLVTAMREMVPVLVIQEFDKVRGVQIRTESNLQL